MSEKQKVFKIGEVSKIVDIPVETIRFFESKGLISPEKNSLSKYRYFDDWDISRLFDYRKLRNMGFSLGQAIELIDQASLEDFTQSMKEKAAEAKREAQLYQLRSLKLENYQNVLRNIPLNIGYYKLTELPACYYLVGRVYNGEQFAFSKGDESKELLEHYSFLETMYRLTRENFEKLEPSHTPPFELGWTIKKKWADALELELPEDMELYRETECIYTVLKGSGHEYFSWKDFKGLIQFMEEQQYEAAGDLLGNILAVVKEGDETVRYMEVWLPCRKKDGKQENAAPEKQK